MQHRGDWNANELNVLRDIKTNLYADINIRTVPVNKKCTFLGNARQYKEDCSFFSALSIIDSYSAGGGAVYNSRVLCPSIPCDSSRAASSAWKSTFYAQLLTSVEQNLNAISSEYCKPEFKKLQFLIQSSYFLKSFSKVGIKFGTFEEFLRK